MAFTEDEVNNMWKEACFLTRVVASSVRVAETAGSVIKVIYQIN